MWLLVINMQRQYTDISWQLFATTTNCELGSSTNANWVSHTNQHCPVKLLLKRTPPPALRRGASAYCCELCVSVDRQCVTSGDCLYVHLYQSTTNKFWITHFSLFIIYLFFKSTNFIYKFDECDILDANCDAVLAQIVTNTVSSENRPDDKDCLLAQYILQPYWIDQH